MNSTAELIAAWAAVASAVIALFILIFLIRYANAAKEQLEVSKGQLEVFQQQLRESSRPVIVVEVLRVNTSSVELRLMNQGSGPALNVEGSLDKAVYTGNGNVIGAGRFRDEYIDRLSEFQYHVVYQPLWGGMMKSLTIVRIQRDNSVIVSTSYDPNFTLEDLNEG